MAESQAVHELKDIPLINSILGLYSWTKSSNVVLTFGLSNAEKGVSVVVESIIDVTGCGPTADSLVSNFVSNLKDSYPILQKPPEKIYRKTKDRTSKYINKRLRSALRSSVGQTFVAGVDSLAETSDQTYNLLRRGNQSNRTRQMSKSEKLVQTEMMSPTKTSRGQQTRLTGADDRWVKKLTHEDEQKVQPTFELSYYLLLPLEFFVYLLRAFQTRLHALVDRPSERRKSSRKRTVPLARSPEKTEEIESRRKVSPKKRLNASILGDIKSAAFRMLGFDTSCVRQTDIRQFLTCSKHRSLNTSPVVTAEEAEKKRKHDDILSDTGESSDDEDLVNMDLKNYISDEDPDYEPTDEDESDESIETDEEDEESDIETLEKDGLLQLKDKENLKPTETKGKEKEKKSADVIKIENTDKPKEGKSRSPKKAAFSPKKAALSPKKQPTTNVQQVSFNKSPVKPFSVKEEKKDSNQRPIDSAKPSETGNKPQLQAQTIGGTEKSGSSGTTENKQGPKKS